MTSIQLEKKKSTAVPFKFLNGKNNIFKEQPWTECVRVHVLVSVRMQCVHVCVHVSMCVHRCSQQQPSKRGFGQTVA